MDDGEQFEQEPSQGAEQTHAIGEVEGEQFGQELIGEAEQVHVIGEAVRLLPGGHMFSLSEAALVCSVSRATVRRALDAKRFPNAYRSTGMKGPGTGPWMIPLADLLSAGFRLNSPVPPFEQGSEQSHATGVQTPPEEYWALRERVARLEGQLEAARGLAAERDRHIVTLAKALEETLRRVPELPPAPESQPVSEAPLVAPRRGFWQRFFGVAEPSS